MIPVTKSFLPPKREYEQYLDHIWESVQLTNNGPCLEQLQKELTGQLKVENLELVSNGSVALEIAIQALELEGEIITTPFTYVATANAIERMGCKPVFADIDPRTFTMDPLGIEKNITPNTSAILATHVFGNACNIEEIDRIARRHNLKVIYDGAHAFGSKYNNRSLFSYGDISTVSFHATKVFHTVEGGALITDSPELADRILKIKSHGHILNNYYCTGTNGKMSEMHAAMGLSNLPYIERLTQRRSEIYLKYRSLLAGRQLEFQELANGLDYNFAYFPVLFKSESDLLAVMKALNKREVYPRRYFYPSLNTLEYFEGNYGCPVSEEVASRILCLPLYDSLSDRDILFICSQITNALNNISNRVVENVQQYENVEITI